MVVEVGDLGEDPRLLVEDLEGLGEGVRDPVLDGAVDVAHDGVLRARNHLGARVPSVQIQGSFLVYGPGNGDLPLVGKIPGIVAGQI